MQSIEDEMLASKKIYEVIKGWAGVPTWHTGHPADIKRFHIALKRLHAKSRKDISESDFQLALENHREENLKILGGKATDTVLREYVHRAMWILRYLKDERKYKI